MFFSKIYLVVCKMNKFYLKKILYYASIMQIILKLS